MDQNRCPTASVSHPMNYVSHPIDKVMHPTGYFRHPMAFFRVKTVNAPCLGQSVSKIWTPCRQAMLPVAGGPTWPCLRPRRAG